MTFGELIRDLRVTRGLSLRDLASRVGIDFTYLSKIENGKADSPSEDVIIKLAWELACDSEQLLAIAGRVSRPSLRASVAHDPRVGTLFRRLQSGELSSDQIAKMLEATEEKGPDGLSDKK